MTGPARRNARIAAGPAKKDATPNGAWVGDAEVDTGGPQDSRHWSIGALAAELGLTTRAIRFYEAKGLIAPVRRGVARSYSRRDRARMLLILRGKNLGFTLEDIKEYLELYDADPAHLAQLKLLAAKVDAHIDDLNRKRADIYRTIGELTEIRAQVAAQLAKQAAKGD